jgi:hypothetical protein
MPKMYFSPSTRGFYAREINGNGIPQDAVELLPDQYTALLNGQSQGMVIGSDANGAPVLKTPAPEGFDSAKARALALLRAERAPVLAALDGLQATANAAALSALIAGSNASASTASAKAQQIEQLKQGLRNAPAAINFAPLTTFEQMRLAGKAYYASLVSGASPEVVAAFKEVA